MAFLDKYTKEEVAAIVKESSTHYEVLIKMGRSANSGSNRMLLTQYIKDNNIDISHFDAGSKDAVVDVFIENSKYGQSTLRRYYQKGNYSEYKCAICGQEPVWNGQPLTLIIDHINGVGNDNRLSNLRWICANCDRQLPTYGSRGSAVKAHCKRCGKELNKSTKSGLCATCYAEVNYSGNPAFDKCPICGSKKKFSAASCKKCMYDQNTAEANKRKDSIGATRQVIKKMLRSGTAGDIARRFHVTYPTVKRWCKQYNLPSHQNDVQKYSDEEWEAL